MKAKIAIIATAMVLAGCGGGAEEPAITTEKAAAPITTQTTQTVTVVETVTEEAPMVEEPVGIAPAGPGGTCGAVSSQLFPGLDGKEVTIESGNVDCVEAYEIMMTYVNTEFAGGGNTNTQVFGDWVCMAPTAGRSEEIQQGAICDKPTGERIYLPK